MSAIIGGGKGKPSFLRCNKTLRFLAIHQMCNMSFASYTNETLSHGSQYILFEHIILPLVLHNIYPLGIVIMCDLVYPFVLAGF